MPRTRLCLAAPCVALLFCGCPDSREAPPPAAGASPPASASTTPDDAKLDRLIEQALDAEQGKKR